jgi:hypothetical protein
MNHNPTTCALLRYVMMCDQKQKTLNPKTLNPKPLGTKGSWWEVMGTMGTW